MPGKVKSVGNVNAQKRFIETHEVFLDEFAELQELLSESYGFSEEKCYPEVATNSAGAELTGEDAARRVVLYLERAAFDDFGELMILAGNGLGFGAKKALRSLYERLVTAFFIAKFPAEAQAFLANADVERGKVLQRAVEAVPELVGKDFAPEKIREIAERRKAADDKKKNERCPKCKQPVTEEAWTRLKLDAMARKVDQGLLNLYGPCYLTPTLLAHATPFGLDLRFRQTEPAPDGRTLEEQYASGSVFRGHFLILRLLQHQDGYYGLNLKDRIDARCKAFTVVWPEDKVDV